MSSRFIVVTGTDTGVGKTVVACGLARALNQRGHRVVACKPVESGCNGDVSEDGVQLAAAARQDAPTQALLRYRAPIAPPLAAERQGESIHFDSVVAQVRQAGQGAEFTLVEGAGGLLSPLTWEHTVVDLALALSASVLLVASDALGVVNHTLLCLNALEQEGLDVAGLVLSTPQIVDESTGSNAELIRRVSGLARIAVLPRVPHVDATANALGPALAWIAA